MPTESGNGGAHGRGGDIGSHNNSNMTINGVQHIHGQHAGELNLCMPSQFDASYRLITPLKLIRCLVSAMELLLKASSPGAFHNSRERFDPPKCFPNTRVAVLDKIMDWVIGKVGWDGFIIWLYGPAGAGKSAIAQTIAELCYAQRRLLASFFFSRSDPRRNNDTSLAASLAYQIALNIPQSRTLIERVVENDPAIFQQTFQAQFNALILEPLMQLSKTAIFKFRI